MGSVTITTDSVLKLKDGSMLTLRDDSAVTIRSVERVKNIDPLAVHLKEVNHIDPLTIESLHVSEVRNIDPIEVKRFDVTNLPMMNVSLQKLPAVDFHVRSLPAVSVGTHQDFCIPSDYLLRAQVLGVELVRLHLNGTTSVVPRDRSRREQARSDNRSFPTTSVAGNPAIPSRCEAAAQGHDAPQLQPGAFLSQRSHESSQAVNAGPAAGPIAGQRNPAAESSVAGSAGVAPGPVTPVAPAGLTFGAPRAAFQLPDQSATSIVSEHRVMSGE